jgi:acetylornithine deacetylase/succinyl-diaminopimelate desuccinylase-like protein
VTPAAASDFEARAQRIVDSAPFKAAVGAFERDFDHFVRDLITLTEIPAPPFGEGARAAAYLPMMIEAGLERATLDGIGNVIALWRGGGGVPLVAVGAHLDTVFPAGTDVKVKKVGTTLRAPGVGDDSRGLAFILAAVRAMRAAGIQPPTDILFIGTVGEEGTGDLRGMRYFFSEGEWRDRIKRFIAIDGSSNDLISNGALGSLRYRVTFKGPGGHSWGAFGQVSPAFALGTAIANLGQLVVPKNPRVSYNVGLISGGTSVNSIPFETSMEVDLRSASAEELKKVDEQFQRIVRDAVAEENRTRATTFGRITADVKKIGDRPSGMTPPDSPLLQQVTATMKRFDKVPVWQIGSTDANIPISLGIPAFAMATQSGNRSGRSHSLDEWTDVEKRAAVQDFSLALAILLSVIELP